MANGVNGPGETRNIQRSSSNPELHKQAADEVLNNLNKGLRHSRSYGDLPSTQGGSSSGGGNPSASMGGSGSNGSPERVSELNLSPLPYPNLEVHVAPVAVGRDSLHTPVKGPQPSATAASSPIRNTQLDNAEGLKNSIVLELKGALDLLEKPAWPIRLYGTPEQQVANKMVEIYDAHAVKTKAATQLDVFLEAFGEVLAEKAVEQPAVFHAFFQTHSGISHRESMISRFSNGFTHRLQEISGLRVSNNPFNVATATKQILHANIGGGDSCIQSMEKALEALGQGEISRSKADLICDLSGILMSATNGGDISARNSGIGTLKNALFESPKLASALHGTSVGSAIEAALTIEYTAKNTALGDNFSIQSISEPATQFHTTLKLATALDSLRPLENASNLNTCVMNQLDPPKPPEPPITLVPTREADLYLRITFPPMATDFSSVPTRAALDGSETAFKNSLMQLVGDVYPPSTGQNPAQQPAMPAISENLVNVLSLFFHKANTHSHDINNKKAVRLQELQAAFTEKLNTGITLPTIADSGDWQPAANSLRELNTAFVDLYRPGEAGYEEKKLALTELATTVMNRYRSVAGAGLQTATNLAITGSHDANLKTINTTLKQHADHQNAFLEIFANAPAEIPMQAAMEPICIDIQRPIDGLLTLKLEVANAKLNAATDTLKDSLKALYLALGKTPATASYEAPIEASQRKGAASASIRTDAGKNIQANTTSEAADTLSNQSRAIHHLADAYTYAKEQIAGAIQNTTSDIATSKTSEVTEDELAAKQKVLEDALTAALHRFATTTSGSGDDAVDGIRDTLKQNEADARRDGIGAIHDFAASGIKDRGEGESDATRLAYLLTQATRLGRFLPESTRTEVISLSASENDRIAALAKAAVIADIMTQKEVLHTTSTALTEFRSRRPDDAQDQAQETTRLATELSGLSELNVWSTDSEIKAYRDAMTAYRVAMASEMQALTVAEREDLASIDTLKKEHAGVVAQYNGQISRPHTPSVEFSRLSTALTTEGEKPHSSTMRDFISAIRADIRAIQASKTQKSEALETANVQFATATTDLEAKLRVFYTAIGADDTAAAIATAKATEAKTSAKVDGDPRIDVQTERTKEATALLTVETASIGELTTKYKAAIVDINAYSLVHEDATALEGELNKILAKFSNSGTPKEVFVYKRLEENISTEIGKATTAAKKLRDTALQNLDALKTELGTVLDRATKSMDERSALLQEAVGLLETISTETTRLFSDSKSEEGEPAHTALNQLSKKVETTYTRFCTTDSDAILAESRGNLGAIGTASSSGLTDIANGLSGGHSKRREAFNNAYTIEGLSLEPRGKRLATLDGFARQLSGAVAVRRAEFQTIRDTYRNATTTLRAAYETAIKDVDFDTVNAQDLRDKTSAFTAACEAAEQGMSTALQGIQPDENQPNVFDSAVTTAHENLKAAFTAGVSASFDTGKATLSALSDATPIAELTARVPMAVALKNRAADLSEFLNEGLLDAVNDITDAHFTLTLTAAEAIANVALAAAQTTAQTMTEPQTKTETPAQLTARMTEFDRAAREALDAFDTAVFGILDNPAGQNTLAALRRSIEARAAQTQTALKIAVSTPLETQRQSIATLLTRDGVTLADLNAAQGQVETLHRRSLDLGNTWVSNKAEIDQTLNAYDAKLGILKATRMAFTSAMKELTFVQKNPLDNTLTDKWSAIRDHEAQFKKLNQDYGHLLKEEAIDTDIAAAREACILRETAARDNLAPETDEILSAIPALLTTLPVDFDWTTTLATISEKLSPDQEIKATLTAAGQSIAGLEEAIRSQLIARDTVETAKKALIAWRPGQPLETVSTHYRNVLSLEKLTEAPFNASAFERGLAVQTYGIDTHVTAIQTLATPIRNTSLKDRWDDIYGQEQALGRLQALDPSKKNVQLQAQISDISTHLKGYAVPSDLERALFIQRLHGVLASSSLTPDQIRKEAQNNAQSEINNPKFQRAIQACHDGSSTLNDPIQKRLTYRQTLNTAEALVDRMADLDQTIGELTTALSNLAETPAEHIDFTSYDTYQKPRVDAATASISARIAELREHTRLLTADVLLDTAAVQMQDGLSVAIQANAFFRRAVAAVRVEGAGYQHALDERIGYRQGIAQANVLLGQVLRGEQLSQVLTNHLGRLAVPANNVVFGEFDRVMGRQLVDINTQFADHQQRVATATQGIQAAQRIIEGIPVAATAAGKWAGLNTANNNFFDALGNQGILWMRQSNGSHIYHPDIQVVVQAETAAFWQKVREVTPETTAIRNAAAASLSAFVAHGSTDPQPVFATLRDGLLDGLNIPPLARNVVETALAGLGIQAEIQSRVDLHVALRDLEDGTTSVTTASVSAIQDQITGLAIKASYTACDTILQTRLTKLSRAAHQAMAIDAINRNSSITKITQGGQTNALIRLAQDWRALENSFQTAPTQYKFRTTLDKAFDDLKIDPKSYIEELRKDYNAIKDQLPGVYQSSMDRALHQLHHRNGPPPLCAYALSAAIGTILEGIDIVADTRGIVTENGNSGPVHKHIAARAKDNSTFTGFADHGDTSVLRQVLNAQAWVMTDFNDIKTIGEDEFTNLMRWMTAPDTTMFTIANPGQVTAIEQLHFLDQIARSFPDLQVYTSSFVTDSGTPISVKNFYDDVWQKIMNESDELIQKYMRIQIQQLIDAMNRSR